MISRRNFMLAFVGMGALLPFQASAQVTPHGAFGCGLFKIVKGQVSSAERARHLSFVLPGRLSEPFDARGISSFDPAGVMEGFRFSEVTRKDGATEQYIFSAADKDGLERVELLVKKLPDKPIPNATQFDAALMTFGTGSILSEKSYYRGLCFYYDDAKEVAALEAEQTGKLETQ